MTRKTIANLSRYMERRMPSNKTYCAPLVGDIFWRLNIGYAARGREQKLEPVRVTKVGIKWFTVAPDSCPSRSDRFTIHERMQDKYGSADAALYAHPREWEDEKETAELWA